MELRRFRPQAQSRLAELNSQACAVPDHEPRGWRFSPRKFMKKHLFRVHVQQVQSADSVIAPSLDNEAVQHTSQSGEVTRSHNSGELVHSTIHRELAQTRDLDEEDDATSHSYPNGALTFPTRNDATQTIDQSAQRSQSEWIRNHGSTATIRSTSTPTIATHIDGTNYHTSTNITAMQNKNLVDTGRTEYTDLAESGATEDLTRSTGIEEHAIRLSIKSRIIYNPEDGIYVGLLDKLPPSEKLDESWHSIRKKLVTDLLQATRNMPKSVKASQRRFLFEPELCMSGQVHSEQQDVLLKPTIWISCNSIQYQRFIQDAIKDLDYTRRFPVHVTQNAPQPASRRSFSKNTPNSGEETNATHSYEMSGAIREEDGYTRRSGDQIEISVQHPSSNKYSACGLEIRIRLESGIEYACRLGGLVRVNEAILGLTTAHAILKPSKDDNLLVARSKDDSLFIFDAHSKSSGLSVRPPLHASSSITNRLPATLWLAEYGASSSSATPSVQKSSHSSITLDEDICDFALLQIDFGNHQKPGNLYRNELGLQTVKRETDDLKRRAVDVVCSHDDVRSGWLLVGERIIVSDAGCWKTRKIQLKEPLDRGFSGTWVVSGGEAIGMIVAVYNNQPYVHMIPMASVFQSIQQTLRQRSGEAEVHILSTMDDEEPNPERPQTQPHVVPVMTKPRKEIALPLSDNIVKAKSEKPGIDNHNNPHNLHNPEFDAYSSPHLSRFLKGLFVPICLMVLAIGLDASAFPVIMPSVADTLGSTHTIGWFGSVYFLALGATFPLFHDLYPAISRLSYKRGTMYTLLLVSLVFEVGSLCCYFASNDALVLSGRILSGISAAGVMSGAAFTISELSPLNTASQKIMNAWFLAIYALSRCVGSLFGAAAADSAPTERAWRYVFLINLAVMALPIATLLICLTPYGWSNLAYSPPTTERETRRGWKHLYRATFIVPSILLIGTTVFFELVLHYVALNEQGDTAKIGTAAGLAGVFLFISFVWFISGPVDYRRDEHAVHAVNLFSYDRRKTTTILLLSFSWGLSYHTFAYYLPLWLRTVRGYSVLETGTRSLPTAAVYVFAGAFVAIIRVISWKFWRFHSRVPYILILSSLVCMALSSGLMTRFDDSTPISTVVGLQILFGVAAGCGALQATSMTPQVLQHLLEGDHPPFEQRMAWYNLVVMSDMLGGSIGISAAQTVFMRLLSRGANHGGLALDDMLRLGITRFRERLGNEQLHTAVEVLNSALTRSFYVSTAAGAWAFGLCVLSFILTVPKLIAAARKWI